MDVQDSMSAARSLFEGAALSDLNYVSGSAVCDLIKQGDVKGLREVLPLVTLTHPVIDATPPLHLAVRENREEIVDLLLEWGSEVNQRDGDGRTPLHIATSNGHRSMAQKLLAHQHCEVDLADNFGQFPLHNSTDNEDRELTELLLLSHCDPDAVNVYGKTALHLAIKQRNIELVEVLVGAGARCDIRDHNGQTALHIAAKTDNLQVLKLLSTRVEADFNAPDKLNRTPLLWGITTLNLGMVEFLCEMGVDLTVKNYFGESTLFTAAQLYCRDTPNREILREIILLLVEQSHGVSMDSPNNRGTTPLQLFVCEGHLPMAHLWLLNGADVNQTTPQGRSLVYLAVEQSDLAMTELLLRFAPDLAPDQASLLHLAAFNGNDELLELLLKNGVEKEGKLNGHTALHVAAAQAHGSTVALLILHGADKDSKDDKGNTPLHYLLSKSSAFDVYLCMRNSRHRVKL